MFENQHPHTPPSQFSNPKLTRSLQIELFPSEQNPRFSPRIKAKLVSKSSLRYLELELFKQHLHGDGEMTPYHTYTTSRAKVRCYRMAFFGIGALFFAIAIFAFQQNLILFSIVLGNVSLLAKAFLSGSAMTLSVLAGWIGYSLCVAREASGYVTSKAKRKLLQLYALKRLEKGLEGMFIYGKRRDEHCSLKQKYHEALAQIEEHKETTVYLLKKIEKYIVAELSFRELLFNQALAELNDQLKHSLQNFQNC